MYFAKKRANLSLAFVVTLLLSTVVVASPAHAGTYTLTCTQTGADTTTPYSLAVNNANDAVQKDSADQCGGALTVPEGVRRIEFGAFVSWTQQNTPLTNPDITSISLPSTLETIEPGGFINLLSVSNLIIPARVTSIGHQAFQGMTSLQNIRIEGSATSTPTFIDYFALNLNSVNLSFGSGLVVLGNSFGAGATLQSLDLGSGLVSIGVSAFEGQSLTELSIPPSVTTISARAFANWSNLSEVSFGSTTPGITTISPTTFQGTNIRYVQYCGGNQVLDDYLAANLPNADVYCDTTVLASVPSISNAVAGDNSVTLTITPGATNSGAAPRNYAVEYSTDSTTWTSYIRSATNSTTLTVPNLVNETSYTFRVASINPAGTSSFSATTSAISPRQPRFGITYLAGTGSGTPPTESLEFLNGETATLKAPGLLSKQSFSFAGWFDGANTYSATASYTVGGSAVTMTAQWIQNSLFGIDPASLTLIGTLTAGNIDSTLGGTVGQSSLAIAYTTGGLPSGTVIRLNQLTPSTRAQSLITETQNLLLSFIVSWLAPDGTVPVTAAGKPLTLTVTDPSIKTGAAIYSVIGDTVTQIGTATTDGTVAIPITEDPEIVIAVVKPGAPSSVTATGQGNGTSVVSWTAPNSNGGGDISSYLVTSNQGQTCTTAGTSCTVTGLSGGTSYTFTVRAVNAAGNGVASAPSNAITTAGSQPSAGSGGVVNASLPQFDAGQKFEVKAKSSTLVSIKGQSLNLISEVLVQGVKVPFALISESKIEVDIVDLEIGDYQIKLVLVSGLVINGPTLKALGELAGEELSTSKLLLKVNQKSSWLDSTSINRVKKWKPETSKVVCIAYNNKTGIESRRKALARANHACSQLGPDIESRVYVYGKAPSLAGLVKLVSLN